MTDESSLDLKPGDFLYQSNSELFLVLIREEDDSYLFAAHGWRRIGKERTEEYVEGEHAKLYTQEEIDEVMADSDNDQAVEHYKQLRDLFGAYDHEFEEDGPHTDFALEDT